MDKDVENRLTSALTQKLKIFICPICQKAEAFVADGFVLNNLQQTFSKITFGGNSVPTVLVICRHCGFVSQFALGVIVGDLNEFSKFVEERNKDGERK